MKRYVDELLLRAEDETGDLIQILTWGDAVEVLEENGDRTRLRMHVRDEDATGGVIVRERIGLVPTSALTDIDRILKVNFIDVQQGDGMVVEAPGPRVGGQQSPSVMLIDGGDNQLFARYLASRYRKKTVADPLIIDAILITHGDADHFSGLSEIAKSETNANPDKKLFVFPRRVYHNGLVKRPGMIDAEHERPDREMFGRTFSKPEGPPIVCQEELVNDLDTVDNRLLNKPFRTWKRTLQHWNEKNRPKGLPKTECRRLEAGMDDAFDFLRDAFPEDCPACTCEVLAPILESYVEDGVEKRGLKFLGEPSKGPMRVRGQFTGESASHTVNGHSIVLKLRFGNVGFLFAGDLNEEAEVALTRSAPDKLRSEIFKVSHHGSHDYDMDFLKTVSPLVSIVSSGDESERKEYIHPRANLLGALGRASRTDDALIFITELAAFFEMKGMSQQLGGKKEKYFGFRRSAFGMVRVRTDGRRMLVTTDSAKPAMKEAYVFDIAENGEVTSINSVKPQ